MRNMTKKEATTIINAHKGNTSWYNGEVDFFGDKVATFSNLYEIFIRRGFGEAETNCIIAALRLSGADITV